MKLPIQSNAAKGGSASVKGPLGLHPQTPGGRAPPKLVAWLAGGGKGEGKAQEVTV